MKDEFLELFFDEERDDQDLFCDEEERYDQERSICNTIYIHGDSISKHCFEHAGLVDFNEPVDMWNNRDILPAMVIKNCYIPVPMDDDEKIKTLKL